MLVHLPPLQPPYLKWYDSNAYCDYHVRAIEHTTEDCIALKYKVMDLMKTGALNFEITARPNVNVNLLPTHAGAK